METELRKLLRDITIQSIGLICKTDDLTACLTLVYQAQAVRLSSGRAQFESSWQQEIEGRENLWIANKFKLSTGFLYAANPDSDELSLNELVWTFALPNVNYLECMPKNFVEYLLLGFIHEVVTPDEEQAVFEVLKCIEVESE